MDIFTVIIAYLVFLLSTTIHEAAHALAAKMGGDLTAYHGGQVSLDPIPHIKREPVGMVVFPVIFLFLNGWPFGWASTPYNALWERDNHKKAALMALAGPLSNLLLALLAVSILKLGLNFGYFRTDDVIYSISYIFRGDEVVSSGSPLSGIVRMLAIMYDLNIFLFLFNLMPLPPLDGSSVITFFMSKKTANSFIETTHTPVFSFIGLIILWNLFQYVFSPAYSFITHLVF